MWAMMPMLRTRSRGSCRTDSRATFGATATAIPYRSLPAVVTEGLVGLGHLVRLFLAPHRSAGVVHRVEQFRRELLAHRLAGALARRVDEPARRERHPSRGSHLDRDLVRRAADAPRLHLDKRRRVADRGVEDLDSVAPRLPLGLRERAVHDRRRNGLLPALHDVVDELLHGDAVVAGVGQLLAYGGARSTRHQAPAFCFSGAFAPYFDRPCLRSRTPAASSVPRTMWYFTDGRSFTRPPRTSTTECSCRLCPIPGMYAVTSMLFVSRTRAILRSAEFGFFGVIVRTTTHTPRFCGAPRRSGVYLLCSEFQVTRNAGVFTFFDTFDRGLRTSWAMVGIRLLFLCERARRHAHALWLRRSGSHFGRPRCPLLAEEGPRAQRDRRRQDHDDEADARNDRPRHRGRSPS